MWIVKEERVFQFGRGCFSFEKSFLVPFLECFVLSQLFWIPTYSLFPCSFLGLAQPKTSLMLTFPKCRLQKEAWLKIQAARSQDKARWVFQVPRILFIFLRTWQISPGQKTGRDVLSIFLGAGELHRELQRALPCFLNG